MEVLHEGRHRRRRGSTLSLGPLDASAQAPGPALMLLWPRSRGFLVSVPHLNSGHRPGSHGLR